MNLFMFGCNNMSNTRGSGTGDKMSWPIRFESLNLCSNLINANLLGHYFDNTISPYIFVVNSLIKVIN